MAGTVEISLREAPEWPIPVRPVLDDLVGGWMPDVEEALLKCRGSIVGVSGSDTLLTASIASMVAAWMGARGRQVTLVDACIENPVIAKALLDDGDEGLVDAVAFGVSTSIVARRTLATSVNLVTAGSRAISRNRVLGADAFRVVLDKLARDGALVLVVLPRDDVERALWVLDSVVAVGRTVGDISSVEEVSTDSVRPGLRNVMRLLVSIPGVPPHEERRVQITETVSQEDVPVDEGPPDGVASTGVDSGNAIPNDVASDDTVSDRGTREEAAAADVAPDDEDAGTHAETNVTGAVVTAREPVSADAVVRVRRRGRSWIPLVTVLIVAILAVGWQYRIFWHGAAQEPEEGGRALETSQGAPEPERTADAAIAPIASAQEPIEGMPDNELARARDDNAADEEPANHTSVGSRASLPEDAESAFYWTPASVGHYVIFTSSHKRETAAHYDMGALLKSGLPAALVAVDLEESGVWYRVAIDAGFGTVGEATDLLETVRELGYEGAWIERLREPTMDLDSGK